MCARALAVRVVCVCPWSGAAQGAWDVARRAAYVPCPCLRLSLSVGCPLFHASTLVVCRVGRRDLGCVRDVLDYYYYEE